jgi:Ca2+-binding RTX toxin-like protein
VTARRSRFRTRRLSRIEIYGQGGGDNIQIENQVTLPVLVLCGGGNNFVHTGGGPSVVVAGAGDDVIEGGSGRNVLIGGQGRDHLKAGPHGDILIAGSTDYDANPDALRDILRQWAAPLVGYADRVARLRGSLSGENGSAVLTPAHVHHARGIGTLEGGSDRDWFLARPAPSGGDDIKRRSESAIITGI